MPYTSINYMLPEIQNQKYGWGFCKKIYELHDPGPQVYAKEPSSFNS